MQTIHVDSAQQGPKSTVLIMGDQINRGIASLAGKSPDDTRILFIELAAKFSDKQWHKQKVHLLLSALKHFAKELREEGFEVDYRIAENLSEGVTAHKKDFDVSHVIAMEPMNWNGKKVLENLDIKLVRNNQFLCHYEDFAEWTSTKTKFKMEDFYRWQRKRLDILMDGSSPREGKWNFDHDNRERPPRDGREWPSITLFEHDEIDNDILKNLDDFWGAYPKGVWPVTREQALIRLNEFINGALKPFGPYEDAMLGKEWKLAHSVLSSSLNIGLLHPMEVVRTVEQAYTDGEAPINSVEGFIRQVIGWREFIRGIYREDSETQVQKNYWKHDRQLTDSWYSGKTGILPLDDCILGAQKTGYSHHIPRLMVICNLMNLSGVSPHEIYKWFMEMYIDSTEWVMIPNVYGMATFSDGGLMSTKPYTCGSNYILKMSNYKRGQWCNVVDGLYWRFIDRHQSFYQSNPRLGFQVSMLNKMDSSKKLELFDLADRFIDQNTC